MVKLVVLLLLLDRRSCSDCSFVCWLMATDFSLCSEKSATGRSCRIGR